MRTAEDTHGGQLGRRGSWGPGPLRQVGGICSAGTGVPGHAGGFAVCPLPPALGRGVGSHARVLGAGGTSVGGGLGGHRRRSPPSPRASCPQLVLALRLPRPRPGAGGRAQGVPARWVCGPPAGHVTRRPLCPPGHPVNWPLAPSSGAAGLEQLQRVHAEPHHRVPRRRGRWPAQDAGELRGAPVPGLPQVPGQRLPVSARGGRGARRRLSACVPAGCVCIGVRGTEAPRGACWAWEGHSCPRGPVRRPENTRSGARSCGWPPAHCVVLASGVQDTVCPAAGSSPQSEGGWPSHSAPLLSSGPLVLSCSSVSRQRRARLALELLSQERILDALPSMPADPALSPGMAWQGL